MYTTNQYTTNQFQTQTRGEGVKNYKNFVDIINGSPHTLDALSASREQFSISAGNEDIKAEIYKVASAVEQSMQPKPDQLQMMVGLATPVVQDLHFNDRLD